MSTVVAAQSAAVVAGGKRRVIFPILAGLVALVGFALLDGVREAIAPWSLHVDYDPQPEANLWHYAAHGATVGMLFSGSMLALVWQPARKPMLLQMYMLGFLTLGLVYTIIDPNNGLGFLPMVAVVFSILFAAYPDRRAVLRLPRPGASRLLLGLTALAAVAMSPAVVRALTHAYDSPAFEGAADPTRWGAEIIMSITLVIGGLLVSSKRGGWQSLGVIVGLIYLYVGVAAISIPDQAGSWGYVGGAVSLAFGVIWLVAVWRERS
ncbi:MAG: hypothetical protein M9890_10450 [Thermomicrobiales bacterium]|nr:hypothetical protein [Thermomicrobiales bacterium]